MLGHAHPAVPSAWLLGCTFEMPVKEAVTQSPRHGAGTQGELPAKAGSQRGSQGPGCAVPQLPAFSSKLLRDCLDLDTPQLVCKTIPSIGSFPESILGSWAFETGERSVPPDIPRRGHCCLHWSLEGQQRQADI